MNRQIAWSVAFTLGAVLGGCERNPEQTNTNASVAEPALSNRVDINTAVRQNLGITFARVESRNVAQTLRVPGRFELLPTARREYRMPAAGRVELLVQQYQRVEAGDLLYRLDMPRWRELQRELTDIEASVRLAKADLDSIGPLLAAHEEYYAEIQNTVDLWTQRVADLEQLQAAGGARGGDVAQAKASLATAGAAFAEAKEKEAELTARALTATARFDAAQSRMAILLESASSLTTRSVSDLTEIDAGKPKWQRIGEIEILALSPGVVDLFHAISGSFVEQSDPVLTTVQPDKVRFRAHALQSDLGKLRNGLTATVVAPQGGSLRASASIAGTLILAPTADAERRTIEILMTPNGGLPLDSWARAGVSAFLEIVVSGGGGEELAIPLTCVARDGTQSIIFRRDPADPDKAIRMDADLGLDDGRWVVIKSGVAEGNEIVLDGVYQLMVATSGSITKGGHFHPDGTFHDGDD